MATVSYALRQVKAHLHEVVPERDYLQRLQ